MIRNYRTALWSAALIGLLAMPVGALAQQKTVKQCNEEWTANKASIQASAPRRTKSIRKRLAAGQQFEQDTTRGGGHGTARRYRRYAQDGDGWRSGWRSSRAYFGIAGEDGYGKSPRRGRQIGRVGLRD